MSADNNRRLENIVRFGTIKSINPTKPIPRVIVNLGDIDTPEIRCLNIRSGKDSTWDMPSINEECVVISPCGDIGQASFVMFGFYNDEHPAPSDDLNQKIRMFADGCVIAYDVSSHQLSAVLPSGGTANIVANVTIEGTLHVTKTITADQDISTGADVKAGEISLKKHKTSGVKGGSENSGVPIP
ncbi:phage baseplate assembly protein V [Acinetobacter silvestris]|uniref:Baseplate assembly protein n=1 Tax=Acinetobacter silvestris TaxID=1977882 RepID=A0A1Y3CJY0_9GAMM|nr:phage baseplate assembly protein V [Acinetobacter silvestris]OTG65926.1 baseplate assembly protein [Acinetobacter silvestris]